MRQLREIQQKKILKEMMQFSAGKRKKDIPPVEHIHQLYTESEVEWEELQYL